MKTPHQPHVLPLLAAISLIPTSSLGKPESLSPTQLLDQCQNTLIQVRLEIGSLLTDLQIKSRKLNECLKDNFDDLNPSNRGNRTFLDFDSFDKCDLTAKRVKETGGDFDLTLTECFGRARDAWGIRFGYEINPNARILEQLDQCTNVLDISIEQRDAVRNWRRYIEAKTNSVLKSKKRKRTDHDDLVHEKAERLRKLQHKSR